MTREMEMILEAAFEEGKAEGIAEVIEPQEKRWAKPGLLR